MDRWEVGREGYKDRAEVKIVDMRRRVRSLRFAMHEEALRL